MLKLRAVAVVAGIVGVTVGPWMAYDDFVSASWPSVDGVIRSAGVTPTRRNWRVDLSYTYSVREHPYKGHLYRPSGSLVGSEAQANRICAAYPAGSQVKVYYEPADPRFSALKPGLHLGDAFLPLLGIVGLAYGLWPRRSKPPPSASAH